MLGKRALHDSQYSDDQSRDGIGTYTSLVDGHCKKWLPRWPKANVESHMSGEACGACSLTETGTAAKRQRDNQQRTKILTPSRWEEDTSDSRSNDRKHSSSPPSRSLQGSKQESKSVGGFGTHAPLAEEPARSRSAEVHSEETTALHRANRRGIVSGVKIEVVVYLETVTSFQGWVCPIIRRYGCPKEHLVLLVRNE